MLASGLILLFSCGGSWKDFCIFCIYSCVYKNHSYTPLASSNLLKLNGIILAEYIYAFLCVGSHEFFVENCSKFIHWFK